MRYEGDIYRPPSEAYSLLVQVTIGCSHNECTFCSMFKDKEFRVRKECEVFEDLEDARLTYANVGKIFLCDGDALCLSNDRLIRILRKIRELFPECKSISCYGNSLDVIRKSEDELAELRDNGLTMVYIGAESGDPRVLEAINKGVSRDDIIRSVTMLENADIRTSVTFISGLAGRQGWREHARATGNMITEMGASFVALLTLMVEPGTELYNDIKAGDFELLTPDEVLCETYLLLENSDPEVPCVFRSNHASNYISLKGNLPDDKEAMLAGLRRAMDDKGLIKPEDMRML